MVLLTTACGATQSAAGTASGSSAAANSDADDTITLAITDELTNIDITHAYGVDINLVINSLAEGLYYFDENNEIQPRLAESAEQTDDTTYVYKIKEGVTFSDGTDLTAEDVEYSLNRQKNPENDSSLAWMFANVDSIEKTGDYEVTVKLKKPDATWEQTLATTAGLVVSKAYTEAHKDDIGTAGVGIVGSGPYIIDSWDQGEQLVLVKNDNYWDKEASIDFSKAVIKIIKDSSVAKLSLEQGDIDYASWIGSDNANELDLAENVNVQNPYAYAETYLSFNNSVEKLADVNLHKAVAYAIDKKAIVDSLFYGKYAGVANGLPYGEETVSIEKDSWKDFFESVEPYDYDLEKAKEYLAKSSSPDGLSVTLKYNSEAASDESVALAIQQNLADINIDVKLEGVTYSEIGTLRYGGSETRDYELLLAAWGSDYPDPVGVISPMFVSTNNGPGGSNWFEYNNKEFDQLIEKSNAELDQKKRAQLLQEATGILVDELPGVPLYYQDELFALSSRVNYTIGSSLLYNVFIKDFKKA